MFQVRLTGEAQRSFDSADAPLQRKLDRCFEQLSAGPRGHPNARALRGELARYFRYRVGDWRVIYRIDDEKRIVWVVLIAHRREAYR